MVTSGKAFLTTNSPSAYINEKKQWSVLTTESVFTLDCKKRDGESFLAPRAETWTSLETPALRQASAITFAPSTWVSENLKLLKYWKTIVDKLNKNYY